MNRRAFILNSALATTGLIISPSFLMSKKPKVIIIGAGFSGLAAALKLHKKNIDFVVLEARKRIGGRVFSHTIDEGENLIVELGAEWVGESHSRLRTLCGEMKLTLDDNQFDTHLIYDNRYYKNTEWDFSKDWKIKFDQLKKKYATLTVAQKTSLDNMDWWRYLNNNGCTGFDLAVRELGDSTDFGESIRHVSALAALGEYAESSDKNEMDYKIQGGNAMLAKKIVDKIGADKLKLDCAVTKIVQHQNGVEVHCSTGEILKADKIICTIPTFSLKKINWQPALNAEQVNAINALQYARINKNPILFNNRFWKDERFDMITDMPGHYFYHATKNQVSKKGALISYTIGDKADIISTKTDEDRLKLVDLSLNKAFENVSSMYEKQTNYYWGNDMYSYGAYALYGIGQWKSTQNILKKHFMHTHFAGEHLADWQGFMEGAINTGEDAVDEILN
jgi:monoamine oxidase